MTKITAYNSIGTKGSRVVATFEIEGGVREALQAGAYRAAQWNKDETRKNMMVNFIMADGQLRAM
jgi:hypothetical protein